MDSGTVSVLLEHKVLDSKLFCIFNLYTALCLIFDICNHNKLLIRLVIMYFIIDLILWPHQIVRYLVDKQNSLNNEDNWYASESSFSKILCVCPSLVNQDQV